MSMKPGCVVYNPEGKSWCVLVESRKPDGTVARFMSFHETSLAANLIAGAHIEAAAGDPNVTVSMFEYEFVANDTQLRARLLHEAVEEMLEEYSKKYYEKERCNDCND